MNTELTNKKIELLKEKKHNFECIDIFEEQNINKKYDIILISNIIEYLILLNNKELEQSFVINMYNLLEDDGIIISTKVLNSNYQESEMDNYFDKKASKHSQIRIGKAAEIGGVIGRPDLLKGVSAE